jgi:hypothetical protein
LHTAQKSGSELSTTVDLHDRDKLETYFSHRLAHRAASLYGCDHNTVPLGVAPLKLIEPVFTVQFVNLELVFASVQVADIPALMHWSMTVPFPLLSAFFEPVQTVELGSGDTLYAVQAPIMSKIALRWSASLFEELSVSELARETRR